MDLLTIIVPARSQESTHATSAVKLNSGNSSTFYTTRDKYRGEWCSAINCSNSRRKCQGLSFFKFPKDIERCKIWVLNTRRKDLLGQDYSTLNRRLVLCAKHFEDSQFMNPKLKNKLVWNAVPTLFDVPNPPPKITPDDWKSPSEEEPNESNSNAKTQKNENTCEVTKAINRVDESQSNRKLNENKTGIREPWPVQVFAASTLREEILKRELRTARSKIWYLKKKLQRQREPPRQMKISEIVKQAAKYMSPELLTFFSWQMKMGCRKTNGERWSNECKEWSICLYKQSPRAYRFCRNLFKLPSINTLRKMMSFKDAGQVHQQLSACSDIESDANIALTDYVVVESQST